MKKVEGGKIANVKPHPCSMPIGLAERAIRISSNEEDVVLDPFMGSGTTAIAARNLNRFYLGFEISSEYVAIAENRLLRKAGFTES